MLDLLALDAGGREALAAKPRAVFDVCPSPPLTWSEFACRNVMDLARAHVPAELISMPLAGVAAPVTLIGSIVQHAADSLAGVLLHQLAGPARPSSGAGRRHRRHAERLHAHGGHRDRDDQRGLRGGRHSLGLPTHGYLGATDAKVIDAQAGLETGMTALVAASRDRHDLRRGDARLPARPERREAGDRRRRHRDGPTPAAGIGTPTETLATGLFAAAGPEGRFLELEETRRLFRGEQFLPSTVIDRDSRRAWLDAGGLDAFARARVRVDGMVAGHALPELDPVVLASMVGRIR